MSTIITRNSATSGSTPSSLVQGELAINVTDGRLFYGSGSGNIVKEFTGSAGGTTINTGSFVTTSSFNNYTGSNTSQFAGTASYATNALTASYAISASYEINYETSSSYADFAVSASHALNANNAISSSYALTASYVQNAQTASYVQTAQTASYVQTAQTSSFITASNVYGPYGSNSVLTASYALNGGVTQLLAGPNVILSPTNGLGQVTVSATLSGSTIFNTATGSYGSFYDTTNQTNPVANIARSMSFNSTDITNGVSISGSTSPFNTYIKTTNAGVYDIQFSAQVEKTDSGTDVIVIWLRKNGIDLTDSATKLTLSGNGTKVVAAWNWFVSSAANDYYQIIWVSADTGMRLYAEPINDTPGIPSVILTVNRVDQFLSNTGSFSGSFTGTLTGTASYATQSLSSSYATTASYVLQAVSASYSQTASYVNPLNQTVEITGSLQVQNSIDSSLRFLFDSTGTASLDWEDGYLYNGSGSISVDWRDRKLYDSNVANSVNWNSRELFKSDGTTVTLNWETGAFTGSILGTASYATNALSSSFATTASYYGGSVISASYALTASSVNTLNQNVVITGSLSVTSSVYINNALYSNQTNTLATENKILYSAPTSTYDALFVEYIVKNGSNVRAGQIMSATDGTSIKYTETTTTDIGSTSPITFAVSVAGGNIRLEASASTSTWTVKTITRAI
jgi:hypothetical protein